jgi:putative toxin-antitoxin system antitoxin component (TIGR02293 family)
MALTSSLGTLSAEPGKTAWEKIHPAASSDHASLPDLVSTSFACHEGLGKAVAARLFQRVAEASPQPWGRLRAELIPDSSWKRAGRKLGPQASQTTARLSHVLALAERVWGSESEAIAWLHQAHAELRGSTPYSLLRTEAGGRAVEALLGALDHGFPV